jgi:hypothetical protein
MGSRVPSSPDGWSRGRAAFLVAATGLALWKGCEVISQGDEQPSPAEKVALDTDLDDAMQDTAGRFEDWQDNEGGGAGRTKSDSCFARPSSRWI